MSSKEIKFPALSRVGGKRQSVLIVSGCLAATDSDTSLEEEHFPELVTASGSSPVRTISDKKRPLVFPRTFPVNSLRCLIVQQLTHYTSFLASKKLFRCFICQMPVTMRISVCAMDHHRTRWFVLSLVMRKRSSRYCGTQNTR